MTMNMKVQEVDEKFPIGMKVLVVDDNPQVLETLLRQCLYQVTSRNSRTTTTDILLELKSNFDLAIINVDMPDDNGFALLQYVELQMDMPVIMLSSHSDIELILKGIAHGACDFLIRPVRIEELMKIWQHVARKKKLVFNKRKTSEKSQSGEVQEEDKYSADNVDHNNKPNKKRKEEKEYEEKMKLNHSEVSSTNNKKSRLVWIPELHIKFVEVVNQLGVEKAVPKKILEMMNDKRLSRENVASHLQKYRLSLKRGPPNHQSNTVFSNSYPPARGLTRPNTPSDVNLYGHTSPGIIQFHDPSDHYLIHTNNPNPLNIADQTLLHETEAYANWSSNATTDSLSQDFSSMLHRFGEYNESTTDGWSRAVQKTSFGRDQTISSGFSDNNTATSHHPNNHTFFHGNPYGFHDQEADEQFFQGVDFQFQTNYNTFNIVSKSEDGVHQ